MRLPITRKKISPLIAIIFIAITFSISLTAQDVSGKKFSLISAQEYAIQHNYEVQNSNFDIKAAKNKLKEITASGLPQISGSIDYNNFLDIPTQLIPGEIFGGEPGSSIPVQFGKQHNATVGLSASQLIFNGSYFVGLQASKIYLKFAEENLERSKIDVKETVTQTYYLVLVAENNRSILQSSLDNLNKILYEVQEHFNEGFVEETDVKQLQISVTQLKNNINMIEEQINFSYMLLKFQMGIDLEQNIALTENLETILLQVNIPQLMEEEFNLNQNISYRMMTTQERIAELSLKNEKSKFLPTVTGFVSYQKNAQRDEFNLLENDGDWFTTTVAGLKLSLPIFNSGSKYFKIQQSKIALKQAQLNKQKVEQGLQLEYSKAEIALSSAFENYESSKNNMQLSKEVYDITLEKFSEGISSSLELTQIHNQYLRSQSDYITAMSELLNAKIQFDSLFN